ncbi:Pollen receptor-like kinase 4 [Hibiscus syriacus]|uniref:non-specific serine/threonine protein kinase n=1 Tax=Hibiscus syriacus TaxID=106335 RepID=A0A6A2WEE4_HIBSY|nr:pollen receptor-like kinase 4 [Hibiscus syriacus]KAE8655691.1 Pollen receptor-like kinase 4 [Hibiscus syriacus]
MVMGTHIARHVRTPNVSLILLLLSLSQLLFFSTGDGTDMENLLIFKDSLENPANLRNWNASIRPCNGDQANWMGVICVGNKIWGLQLENMGLGGMVNLEILNEMPTLRIINLMNNNFEGRIPEMKKLGELKALYLSNNHFTGDIPDNAFQGSRSLKNLFLANNGLSGEIPSSLAALPNLVVLKLEGNQFVGRIPDFKQSVKVANFANNELEGPIPASLSSMSASIFTDNKNLCGPPLEIKCSVTSPPPPTPPPTAATASLPSPQVSPVYKRATSALEIALILTSILLLLALIAAIIFILCKRKQKRGESKEWDGDDSYRLSAASVDQDKNKFSECGSMVKRNVDYGKLVFLKGEADRFDLQDLLKASAEVLGSGNFGASYKAVIMSGEAVVVKRYKQMNSVGREDFHGHMRRLGRLNHENLLPLEAYYYRREEKLLVCRFMEDGSLASHLHGNHSSDKPSLDWRTRLKIVKGIGRGLAYLYNELPSLVVPHGHLKSSNVLLNENFEALLCDYALRPVMNQEQAHMHMTAYKSPEHAINGRINRKTDVWCLGILILEILTGKFPENYLKPSYDSYTNLATWVNEMVKQKRTSELFDTEMLGTKNSKGGMINLLKIGLSCCEDDPETRPELKEVVREIEELKDRDEREFSSTLGEVNAAIFGRKARGGSFSSFNL